MKTTLEFTDLSVILYVAPAYENDMVYISRFKRAVATFSASHVSSVVVFDDVDFPEDYELYRSRMTHCEYVDMHEAFMRILGVPSADSAWEVVRGITKDEIIKRMKACAAYARLL
jgi:hypothetical protein